MKKIALFIALLCAICSQAQVVSNVRAMQQDTTLVIVYDLQSSATTKLFVSFDGGVTFVPANSVSGDIGRTYGGNNRIVYWNATRDRGYFDCDKMVFKITASGYNAAAPTQTTQAVAGDQLEYKFYHVYQNGKDITYNDYKGFLRNNCPEAFRAYKRQWHGMFWGGFAALYCVIPFTMGGIVSIGSNRDGFGFGTCIAFACMSGVTGITLMSCSTIAARKYSVKVYNRTCGATGTTAFEDSKKNEVPLQLSFGTTSQGLGMSLHF